MYLWLSRDGITFEPIERQSVASGVPVSDGQTRGSKAAPVVELHPRKRVFPDSVKKGITRDGTGAGIRMSRHARDQISHATTLSTVKRTRQPNQGYTQI
jgi:hypothetical protein